MAINQIVNHDLFSTTLLIGSCILGSSYGASKLNEPFCVKLFNFILGAFIGLLAVIEFENKYSLAITCIIGLIVSGSGSLIYSLILNILPDVISKKIQKEANKYLGED